MASADWFAGRLRELREAKGWTQAQLAERAALTREGVAQLETGRRRPAWETVLALCDALAVPCTEFTERPLSSTPQRRGRPKAGVAEPTPAPKKRGRKSK